MNALMATSGKPGRTSRVDNQLHVIQASEVSAACFVSSCDSLNAAGSQNIVQVNNLTSFFEDTHMTYSPRLIFNISLETL